MNLAKDHARTIAVAALIVVAIVAGSLAFYFAEQVSSLNSQVSSLDYQVSALQGRILASENQTTALKQSDLDLCQGINRTLSSIHLSLMNFTGALTLQIRTNQLLVMALNTERPANYSEMVLSLNREIGQDGNLRGQMDVLAFETHPNNFYYPSNFCSFAGKS